MRSSPSWIFAAGSFYRIAFFQKAISAFFSAFDMDTAVTPGQRLGYAEDYVAGPGTYERDGLLYASVVGFKRIQSQDEGKVRLRHYPALL